MAARPVRDPEPGARPCSQRRLPWSGWHWLVVLGLGTVWILDGLEVTIVGAIASRLSEQDALGISEYQVAVGGTFSIAGAAVGALTFGYLTDRLGRKKLFIASLALYLLATVSTGFSWSASRSSSARCWRWGSCSFAATCRKARAG